ncbi:MBL fold metallo-hydrolase [Gorillibacterium timonense]|uniref:MBL fold metallo-hydrolase n=1 Tax=Gorillibacterium timonense TaxID=1689269 RepID=UPI00071C3668|nr:MBL fold metallo-hydrolase [Gorillibacterium timonense]
MPSYHVLSIEIPYGDAVTAIHPVLIQDDQDLVLVDCGYPGDLKRIEAALAAIGLTGDQLTRLVITHHDYDHMGAAASFKRKYPHLLVATSEGEAPYVSGEQPSARLVQAMDLQRSLPASEQERGLAFIEMLKGMETVPVDESLQNGERLSWGGGCEVIATPGHTPGHISLYLTEQSVLITGDAAVIEGGELVVANPQYTLDLGSAKESLAKLLAYDADAYICYHGGVYSKR